MTFPKPDRSTYIPNREKTPENDQLDIGWAEGIMSDGRPFRIELWAQDQITMATVFLSTQGLETSSSTALAELLERERVVSWRPGARRSAEAVRITDSAGNAMWSVNVVIGVDDEPARADCLFRPYGSRASQPTGAGDSRSS